MSGGSYNYISYQIDNELADRMFDAELNDLIKDLVKVTHDLEWWQSGDTSEERYRKTVSEFKKKWFGSDQTVRLDRLKGYVDESIEKFRAEVYDLLGVEEIKRR